MLVVDDGCVLIIDFGQVVFVLVVVVQQNWCLEVILFIYYYDDYIGGVVELQVCFLGVEVYVLVELCIDLFVYWVVEGECIQVLGLGLYVVFVFGYIWSYIVFYIVEYFFSGDVLFSLGCGCMFEGMLFQFLVFLYKLVFLLL